VQVYHGVEHLEVLSKYNTSPNELQLRIGGELDFDWNWIGAELELLRRKDERKTR